MQENLFFRRHPFSFFLLLMLLPAFTGNLHAQPSHASSPLFDAIRSGSTAQLNRVLSNGASANDSLNGYSALMACTLSGTPEQMKLLLDHGAAVNYADRDSLTALWLAVPDMEKTKLLLDYGANPQLYSKEGYTVLVKLALTPGSLQVFHLLISKGADPKKSAPDNSLLYNAASAGDTSVVGLLLHSGLLVNDTVSSGDYPINASLINRTFSTLKMLVDNGANVNAAPLYVSSLPTFSGCTPLMFAGLGACREGLFYLLDHGADPNRKNNKGYTALMLLQQSEADDPSMTLALLNHGADASVTALDGADALSLALLKGNTESVALIKKSLHK